MVLSSRGLMIVCFSRKKVVHSLFGPKTADGCNRNVFIEQVIFDVDHDTCAGVFC